MSPTIVRKQISFFITLADWKALRHEAARQHLPMTELCRRWMEPELQKLRETTATVSGPREPLLSEHQTF